MKKWVWLGLVLVVVLIVVAVGFFATTPGRVERAQNKVVPVALNVSPAAQAPRAIAHVRDLVGIDHVGLGSDFDGSTTTGFDASQVAAVTQALMDAGFFA